MNWIFLLSAAGLVAVALVLLLIPMLRHAPQDGKRRPAWGAAALAAVMIAGSAGLYAWIGTPEGLTQSASSASGSSPSGSSTSGSSPSASGNTAQSMDQAVAQLERRLQEQPEDLEGWMLLGRSRMSMENTDGAIAAYRRARELAPERPDVLVALAEAVAQANGHRLAGEAENLIDEALTYDPSHQRALWFAGIADWQAGAYEDAATHWETLLAQLDPNSDVADSVRQQLQAARAEAGQDAGPPAAAEAQTDPGPREDGDRASVSVEVGVSDALADRFGANDLVFVFARPVSGPGVPLAVKRFPAGQLPTTVTLGPDDAMRPENALTPDSEIVVGARISQSGSATPQAGDLEGQSESIVVGDTRELVITIDREVGQ